MTAPIQIKIAEQIRDDYLAEVSANTGISDQNLGAVVRTKAFAAGMELDELYFQLYILQRAFYIRTATGNSLDLRGLDFGLTRLPARSSVGVARFTTSATTTIPPGTLISVPATPSSEAILFSTPLSGSYGTVGAGTVDVPIYALSPGTGGDVGASSITKIETSLSNVVSVTNPSNTSQGRNIEDDDAFRARILRHIAGLSKGTIPSIFNGTLDFEQQFLTLAEGIDASATEIPVNEDLNEVPLSIATVASIGLNNNTEIVTYAGIDTSTTPHKLTGVTRGTSSTTAVAHEVGTVASEYIPTGRGTSVKSASLKEIPCHVDVWIDDGTAAGASSELRALVEKRLRGDGTARDPGYKGGGITLDVHIASPVLVTVEATLAFDAGYDPVAVRPVVQSRIDTYLNGSDVNVDVLAYQMACLIMDTPGVTNILSLKLNGVTFDGALAGGVSIGLHQIARSSSAASHLIS